MKIVEQRIAGGGGGGLGFCQGCGRWGFAGSKRGPVASRILTAEPRHRLLGLS